MLDDAAAAAVVGACVVLGAGLESWSALVSAIATPPTAASAATAASAEHQLRQPLPRPSLVDVDGSRRLDVLRTARVVPVSYA